MNPQNETNRIGLDRISLKCLGDIGVRLKVMPLLSRFLLDTGILIIDNDFSIPFGHRKVLSIIFISITKFLELFPQNLDGK